MVYRIVGDNRSSIAQVYISDIAPFYMNAVRAICAQLFVFGHAGVFSKEFVTSSFIKSPLIQSIAVVIFLSYLVF